jgi:NAD(P)-dependent dehydrogenase (short-subunit alcohol dehydrogenase family)
LEEKKVNRLEGKVAIITGGVQGIGRGCALRVAQEGAKVVIGDIQDDDQTAKDIVAAGGEAVHIAMDTRKREDWKRLVDTAVSQFGSVDLLGNVAGVVNHFGPDNVVEMTDEGWDSVIGTDLKGYMLGMQACIPKMLEAGDGAIVNISSMAALKGMENLAAYSAAKGGVISLTYATAYEYGRQGIRVNAICPGTINTPILKDVLPSSLESFKEQHIIRRLGEPEDIAAAMAFFFSADGNFLTGEVLPVDGGWNTKGSTG